MFLRFQRIALDVSYGFGRNRSMFLIVVFLIKKVCIGEMRRSSASSIHRGKPSIKEILNPLPSGR